MQKYRTFFMNLSHCRSLLESLESHLDPATRNKFSELHKQLHQQACDILDKAAIRSQQMALAASKWISLDQNLHEEAAWLNIVQQRVPNLSAMTCSDYKQYESLFKALDEDMKVHLVRTTQLVSVCRSITNLIDCPHLEPATESHRFEILNLERSISSGLIKLSTFTEYWLEYQTLADRLESWMDAHQNQIESLNKSNNMKSYWELKAQIEFYNTLLDRSRDNFENAMRVFPVSDEVLQRQLYGQLEDRWNKLVSCVTEQNPSFDGNVDFTQFEYELDQLQTMFANPRAIIRTEEDLCIFIQTLRVISEGVAMLERKVERSSCSSASVVCDFLHRLKGLKYQVHEETENALVLEAKILDLKKTFDDLKAEQARINMIIEECEATVGAERYAVERSLERCEALAPQVSRHWSELISVRSILSNLPMKLHVSVSLIEAEHTQSCLQDDYYVLESKFSTLLSSLRQQTTLWQNFQSNVDAVHNTMEQTDFMMDLLQVHGDVDQKRLTMATQRLESLAESLHQQEETLMEELHSSADSLIKTCKPEVSAEVESSVKETVQAWDEKTVQLEDLCKRYQQAVELWSRYKQASDAIANWSDELLHSVNDLPPEEALKVN
ncbi:uncharacterized protein LOC103512693 isoform X1 [Diaphorina citri]|uniref:Uncharacterized protein LOC103512693 isoform X1 n=1 Tax=Diaphorina citri TaxID=121845 RepID=A0A3Q0J0A0_DIACI|nr:uncharacterized protein LOC103512693 isoform X1 [Diaphorina citri]